MDDDPRLSDEDAWFAPKRYGYGAGLPIAREGWIALGAYVAAMILMALVVRALAKADPLYLSAPFAVMIGMTVWFVRLCASHTRGGWRWRWGEDD